MTAKDQDQAVVLEFGLVGLGVLVLSGLAIWWAARALGAARHRQRRAKAPPSPGSVPAERHQNIGSVSTR